MILASKAFHPLLALLGSADTDRPGDKSEHRCEVVQTKKLGQQQLACRISLANNSILRPPTIDQPPMKSQGKNGSSLIERRRVTASTACLYTSTQPEPSGGEPEFSVQLRCVVTKSIRAGPGREKRPKRVCRGANAGASFVGAVPRDAAWSATTTTTTRTASAA